MLKLIRHQGRETRFEYDALGRRTAKIHRNRITRWLWDGNVPLHEWEYDEADRPHQFINELDELVWSHEESCNKEELITWIFDEGTFKPSAKLIGEKRYSIITDYLGTPVQMYDEKGELTWDADYDIYGKIRKLHVGSLSDCPFRYQGQYEDVETGLYYNRFRYYSADSGMYVSQDPIGLAGANQNLYAYTNDNNNAIDPLGLSVATIVYNHKLKPNRVTDLVELRRQMDEQIEAFNRILNEERIEGLKQRVRNYGPELARRGRSYTASLGSAGQGRVWAHTPDMKTGGLPTDVSNIPAGARENSILGGGNARRISNDILNMDNDVTEIRGVLNCY